jgi:hypothetical protein
MSMFKTLAEANIKDWFKRKEVADKAGVEMPKAEVPFGEGKSIQQQLYEEIVGLIQQGKQAPEDEKAALVKRSQELEIQLMVTLEVGGLPLVAQKFAGALSKARQE